MFSHEFENAIVKVMKSEELSSAEKNCLRHFEKPTEITEVTDEEGDFASKILKLSSDSKSCYINFNWIPPTSNIAERFFSQAKLFFGPQRQSLSPQNFEAQIFLLLNKAFWDVNLVQRVLVDKNE